MKTKLTLTGGKGVNYDAAPFELAPGVWSAMSNFRSRSGFDELWEGAYLQYSTGTEVPQWGAAYTSSSSIRRSFYCSPTKVYCLSGGATEAEITRYTDGVVISSMTASGTTVTVNTAAAHGRSNGDAVDVWGAVPTAFNVTGKTITVVDADTFTYTADSAPSPTTATTVGAYSYNVQSNFSALSGLLVKGAPSGASYTIVTSGSANIIKGLQNSAAGDAGDTGTADDTISFVDGQAVAGDVVELWSDGTSWFAHARSKVAAGITFTQAST